MSEQIADRLIAFEAARERRRAQRKAWSRFRGVVANEFVDALPEFVPVGQLPALLRLTTEEIFDAVRRGAVVVRLIDGVESMVTAKSRTFLVTAGLSRLPLPERLDPRPDADLFTVEVPLRRPAVENLRAASRAQGVSLSEYVSVIVEAAACS